MTTARLTGDGQNGTDLATAARRAGRVGRGRDLERAPVPCLLTVEGSAQARGWTGSSVMPRTAQSTEAGRCGLHTVPARRPAEWDCARGQESALIRDQPMEAATAKESHPTRSRARTGCVQSTGDGLPGPATQNVLQVAEKGRG